MNSTFDDNLIKKSIGKITCIAVHRDITEPWKIRETQKYTSSCWIYLFKEINASFPIFVTCAHCVRDYMEGEIYLNLDYNGKKKISLKIWYVFPEIDLAFLILPSKISMTFSCLEIGSDQSLQIGTPLDIYGYPFNQTSLKLSISRLNGRERGQMQLDGSINYGNSGGPVIYQNKVVGWIVQGIADANAISFANPIGYMKSVLFTLSSQISIPIVFRMGNLGIKYSSCNSDRWKCLGISEQELPIEYRNTKNNGIIVKNISIYSPFYLHIQKGDIIYGITMDHFKDWDIQSYNSIINNIGKINVPWTREDIDLDTALYYSSFMSPITIDFWSNKLQNWSKITVNRHNSKYHGKLKLFLPIEEIKYHILAGLVVVPLSKKVFKSLTHLHEQLNDQEAELPHLIIVNILDGSPFVDPTMPLDLLIKPGCILKRVNGINVSTLKAYIEALQKPYRQNYLRIETSKNDDVILLMNTVLKADAILIKQYHYPQCFA